MIPEHRIPTHPGEILLEEFLKPLGVTQVEFARHLSVSVHRINEVIRGRRGITPESAWLFAQALGTSPEFWLALQSAHDLARSRPARQVRRLKKVG
jgi:addiction module HigA family antidote